MNIEKYSKLAPQYYTNELPNILEKLLRSHHFTNILDYGCGDGSIIYSLYKRNLIRDSIINAVDLSVSRVKQVKKTFPKVIARVDSAETLKTVKSNSIDLLISTQVIEHVDDKKMETAMKRVTAKNATIYLSTVFKKWYGWYFYRNNSRWVLDPTHLREYTKDSQLLNILVKDFKVVANKKTLQWFPIIDFVAKRIGFCGHNTDLFLWKFLRSIKVPIPGYYNWELVLIKK